MIDALGKITIEKAIAVYGPQAQEQVAIEELSELITALCHKSRGRKNNVAEEIADVTIMLEQLMIINSCGAEVSNIIANKLKRLADRISKESGIIEVTSQKELNDIAFDDKRDIHILFGTSAEPALIERSYGDSTIVIKNTSVALATRGSNIVAADNSTIVLTGYSLALAQDNATVVNYSVASKEKIKLFGNAKIIDKCREKVPI